MHEKYGKFFLGTGEKNPVMESHLYTCMGSLALTHNFTWSRWNLLSGRRSCILLMREMIENRKLVKFFFEILMDHIINFKL